MAYRLTCADCGYSKIYRSYDHGHYAHGRHRCSRQKELLKRRSRIARRRAWRATGPIRECQHPVADHQHGTHATFVLDKCRCVPCRDANVMYERDRTKRKRYGTFDNDWAPADPVRKRLLELAGEGVNYKQICHLTGLNPSTIGSIIYGRSERRGLGVPPERCKREISDTILGLVVDPLAFTAGHVIDSTGFRRRGQALVAIGWSQTRIATELGVGISNFNGMLMERPGVTVRHMRAMIELYDRWWNTAPPAKLANEKRGITMAKRLAAERRWPPPMAWPDDSIDDPRYRPQMGGEQIIDEVAVDLVVFGHRLVPLSKTEQAMAIERMTANGMSAKAIAERLRKSSRTVVRIRNPTQRRSA